VATVKEVMLTELHMIPANATLKETARWMREHDRGMLPVTENGQVLGVVTDRDIVCRSVAEGNDPERTPISKAMTTEVHWVKEGADVMTAARIMQEHRIRRLLVTDDSDTPVGTVSLDQLSVGALLKDTGKGGRDAQ